MIVRLLRYQDLKIGFPEETTRVESQYTWRCHIDKGSFVEDTYRTDGLYRILSKQLQRRRTYCAKIFSPETSQSVREA